MKWAQNYALQNQKISKGKKKRYTLQVRIKQAATMVLQYTFFVIFPLAVSPLNQK